MARFLSDPVTDVGNSSSNLDGHLKQLYLLKKQNRSLKVILSVGGQVNSSHLAVPASNSTSRSTFASSVISNIDNLGLDGVDINWVYPNASQAEDMVLLLETMREALDAYGTLRNHHFSLSVASPAGPSYYQQLRLSEMNQYVDIWNIMAYDYAGSWSNYTGDQANLFSSSGNMASTPFNTDEAVNFYISQGISPTNIALGMPLYGRYFNNTEGLGKPFQGGGTYNLKDLPLSEAAEFYDNSTGSSYSYNSVNRQLVSYDTITVANQKAEYIKNKRLGGAMYWEGALDGVNQSYIRAVANVLASDGSGLDCTSNELNYTNSTYENLKSGMPDSSSTTTSTAPISTQNTAAILSAVAGSIEGQLMGFMGILVTPATEAITYTSSASSHTSLACFEGEANGEGHLCNSHR